MSDKKEISDTVHETILTADGHKYTGSLRVIEGIAGLVLDGSGSLDYTNGDRYVGDFHRNQRSGGGTLQYSDGGVYEGEFLEDMRHGCGQLLSANGDEFEGTFVKGERRGMGVETLKERGERYTGSFQNGVRHGRGILDMGNGSVYEGEFRSNMMEGKGSLRFTNGDCFVGAFKANAMHGEGTLTFANGDAYVGRYTDGTRCGGILMKADGSKYAAQFSDSGELVSLKDVDSNAVIDFDASKKLINGQEIKNVDVSDANAEDEEEGQTVVDKDGNTIIVKSTSVEGKEWGEGAGSITYTNNDKYEGSFLDNQRHGFGILRCANGDFYEGYWKSGKKSGQGKLVLKETQDFGECYGWRYVGFFENDAFHGHGELRYDAEGGCYSGAWESGKRHGHGHEEVSGDVYEGDFSDGHRNGKGILTLRNGTVCTGIFVNGNLDDDEATIIYSEQEKYVGQAKDTQREGDGHMEYANGDVYDGEFRNDMRHGVGILTLANGESYQGKFVKDSMEGNGTYAFSDGCVFEGTMHNNVKHGSGTFFDASTNETFSVYYRNNSLIERSLLVKK